MAATDKKKVSTRDRAKTIQLLSTSHGRSVCTAPRSIGLHNVRGLLPHLRLSSPAVLEAGRLGPATADAIARSLLTIWRLRRVGHRWKSARSKAAPAFVRRGLWLHMRECSGLTSEPDARGEIRCSFPLPSSPQQMASATRSEPPVVCAVVRPGSVVAREKTRGVLLSEDAHAGKRMRP